MTSDPDLPPTVGLALPDGPLRERLLAALSDADVELRAVERGASLWDELGDQDVDVIVVRRSQLGPEGHAALERVDPDPDAPSVVVVSEGEDPAERATLVAAGASQVLDEGDDSDDLALSLQVIADAERDATGGGPEGRDQEADPRLADFLSRSPYMRHFLDTVRQVAEADSSLLITGETGVGKERLARAIHAESPRSDRPFVAINCGALSENLLESELFGHEKGAFTGADSARIGAFEAADGGTLFLDELGEMPAHLQVKLLTALQRREVQRVGSTTPRPVDLRVIAATNRDVQAEVEAGSFRRDLYYRLAVVPLEVPSLRERAEDIPDLVGRLIRYFRDALPASSVTRVGREALGALVRHDWPGNVRELINAVERGMLLSSGDELELASLPPEVRGATPGAPTAGVGPAFEGGSLREVRENAVARAETAFLEHLLRKNAGRIDATAADAGISPRALYDRLKRYGIDKADFRP